MSERPQSTLRRVAAIQLIVALFGAWQPAQAQPPAAASGDIWRVGPPGEHASQPARLAAAVEAIGAMDGVYSVLVAHRGELVVERYFRDGFREKPHNLKSASKSVLSALTGIAVAEGLVELDRPIVEILPGLGSPDDPRKAAITVRHLLTMTSGLEATSYDVYGEWTAGSDWVRGALGLPLVAEPGRLFQYSTGNTHLLSAVLTAATGMSTREYAQSRLFDPLGVEIHGWASDPQGIHIGGNDLSLTPREMARFGQLFLDGGRSGERQIVPASWVEESTRTGEIGRHDVYGTYRYLWWTDLVYEGAFNAVGYGGQYVYVSPPHDCVVVVTSTLISKGLPWTAGLFEQLRDGVLASFPPSADYYAKLGRPPADPAVVSLEQAVARAQSEIAALARVSLPEAPEVPGIGRTSQRVNLRRGPGTDTARIRLLERGAPLELLERNDGWLRARADGDEGWVHADFVEVENASWRPLAASLRNDLAAFSEAIRERLPDRAELPGGPSAAAGSSPEFVAEGPRATDLAERLAASLRDRVALESQMAELERKFSEQGEQLSADRVAASELTGELRQARARIDSLERQLTAGADAEQAEAAELADARSRIAALEGELASAAAGRLSLVAQLAAADDARRATDAQLAALATEDDELAAELVAIRAGARSRATSLAAVEEARLAQSEQLAEARERIASLELALVAADASRAALTAEVDRQSGAAALAEADTADTRNRLALELEAARLRIANLEKGLAMAQTAQAEVEEHGLQSQASLAGRLTEARDRIATLEGSLAGAGELQKSLEARLARQEAEISQGLTVSSEAHGAVRSQLETARARIAALEKTLSDSATQLATLGSRFETVRADHERRAAVLAQSEEARQVLAAELTDTRQRLAGLEEVAGGNAEARVALESSLAAVRQEADSKKELLDKARSGQAALANRLKVGDAKIVGLEDQLQAAQRDRSRLVARISELGTLGGRQSEAAAALGNELRAANARIRTLEDQARSAEGASVRLGESLKELRAEWEDRTLELAEATRARDALHSQQKEARLEVAALEARLQRSGEERTRLAERLVAAEQRAAESVEAMRQADAAREAMAAEVVAGRQETAARLATAANQIEALELLAAENVRGRQATAVDLEVMTGRVAALESEITASRGTGEQLTADLAAAQRRVAELDSRLAAERAEGEERLTGLEGRLTAELAAAQGGVADLEERLAAERGAGEERIAGLEEQLTVEQGRGVERGEAMATTRATSEELSAQLVIAKAQIVALESLSAGQQESRVGLAAELEAVGERLAGLEVELVNSRTSGERLTDDLADSERRVADLQERLAAKRSEAEERVTDLEGRLTTELAASERRVVELEQRLTAALGAGEEQARALAMAQASADELGAGLAGANDKIGKLEDQAAAQQGDRATLAGELEAMRRRMADLAAEFAVSRTADEASAADPVVSQRVAGRPEERLAVAVPPAAEEGEVAPAAAPSPDEEAIAEVTPPGPAAAPPRDDREAAGRLVREWAAAWSSQDPEPYLAFYAASFQPPGGLDRKAWEDRRRLLLRRPQFIEIEVRGLEVELVAGGERAEVHFVQLYRSDTRRLSTDKTLQLVRESGVWRIERELVSG